MAQEKSNNVEAQVHVLKTQLEQTSENQNKVLEANLIQTQRTQDEIYQLTSDFQAHNSSNELSFLDDFLLSFARTL
jgi:hypothetical protein